jgi:hypothetical protein
MLLFLSCFKEKLKNESIGSTSEESNMWIKTLGGSKNDVAKAVISSKDGGFAVLGYTQSNDGDLVDKSNESFDAWLIRFDAEGELLWSKTFGKLGNDQGASLLEKKEGGYVLLGFQESVFEGDPTENRSLNIWVASLDSIGNLLWEKTFGYSGIDYGTHLIQTTDGGYLLVGTLDVTASRGLGNQQGRKHAGGDYWALKLDTGGNLQWSNYYGGGFTDTPSGVEPTADGGYIIVGTSDSKDTDISNNRGSYDFWVIKISDQGKLLWEKNYGGDQIDEARAITRDAQGNFIVVGDSRSTDQNVSSNKGGADLWVIKISPQGQLLKEKTFGGSSFDVGYSVAFTQSNNLLISGSSRSADGDLTMNRGQNDLWVLCVDAQTFSLKWQQSFGGSNIDFAYDAVQLNNKAIIVVGKSNSDDGDLTENRGFSDLVIAKIQNP